MFVSSDFFLVGTITIIRTQCKFEAKFYIRALQLQFSISSQFWQGFVANTLFTVTQAVTLISRLLLLYSLERYLLP